MTPLFFEEVLKVFHLGQSSSSSSHRPAGISEDTDEPGDVVFSHFSSWEKSAEVAGQVSADLPRHGSSWTPAAYEQSRGFHEKEKEKEEAEYERRVQILNRRVRDDIPLSPTEYEAWRRWSGLPPLSSSSSGRNRKKKKKRKRLMRRTCTSASKSSASRRTWWRRTCRSAAILNVSYGSLFWLVGWY